MRKTRLASFELDKRQMETGVGAYKVGVLISFLRSKIPLSLGAANGEMAAAP
jgi:hypothetical protein